MVSRKICVVGAGVIGLSSAVRIQNTLPDVDITIIADTFSPNTTSDGSAGFWEPHLVNPDQAEDIRFAKLFVIDWYSITSLISKKRYGLTWQRWDYPNFYNFTDRKCAMLKHGRHVCGRSEVRSPCKVNLKTIQLALILLLLRKSLVSALNVYAWGDMSSRILLFQWANTIKIQISVMVQYPAYIIIIWSEWNLFSPSHIWQIVH